tara:strand:- start:685 stop:1017 length:333 start_codon:yes stop_codon:yes gene_type:complete
MNESTQHILEELKKGICELIIVDEFSVEDVISATLSHNHLPPVKKDFNFSSDNNSIHLWNMVKEQWEKYPSYQITNIERLTGAGTKNNDKLISKDYINTIECIFYEEEKE